jgi:hypothetical protein
MRGKLKGATMKWESMPRFRRIMLNLAIVFGGYAAVMLLHHDLYTGLWSFAVCFAFVLGLLPAWLTGSKDADKIKPEKYSLFGE